MQRPSSRRSGMPPDRAGSFPSPGRRRVGSASRPLHLAGPKADGAQRPRWGQNRQHERQAVKAASTPWSTSLRGVNRFSALKRWPVHLLSIEGGYGDSAPNNPTTISKERNMAKIATIRTSAVAAAALLTFGAVSGANASVLFHNTTDRPIIFNITCSDRLSIAGRSPPMTRRASTARTACTLRSWRSVQPAEITMKLSAPRSRRSSLRPLFTTEMAT